jgi:ANTAR domain
MPRGDDFEEHLSAALVTRPAIEQAKGVLVTLCSATPDKACTGLHRACQAHNDKVEELVGALVETAAGRTPGNPERRRLLA